MFSAIIQLNDVFKLHRNTLLLHQSASSVTENKDIKGWGVLRARKRREESKGGEGE